ncbi:MAG: hypothetical protein LBQ33_05965, partial [Oscillospiraceae bacterium]|nr:hypothetical protein [Oscillospiraceae bacterium]
MRFTKKLVALLSVLLAAAVALAAFAACGKDEEEAPSSTVGSTAPIEHTLEPESTTLASGNLQIGKPGAVTAVPFEMAQISAKAMLEAL